ncbi:DUF6879 family protein [Actinophytocola sp. NPDC049390]|uniref:DUF6879 family protein n=1 Tax=Actinophytocola sp. NPDC049390 TaxID=3363894 RepID=UPI0037BAC7B3
MLLDGEQFARHLTGYERSAWRFETQPSYTMAGEQESLSRWRSGERKPDEHNAGWHETVRAAISAGKDIGRVRVVRYPLTEYQRYQFDWGIPGNIEAGEDIRVLDLTDVELDLPVYDFWLFDDSLVVDLNFNPDGTLLNVDQRENADLEMYRRWQCTALAHAVPFGEYDRT